jgi:chorismate synthase
VHDSAFSVRIAILMLRFLTAGESHGPELVTIIEGAPAGFEVDLAAINQDLARRQKGCGRGGRILIEKTNSAPSKKKNCSE